MEQFPSAVLGEMHPPSAQNKSLISDTVVHYRFSAECIVSLI